MTGVGMSRAAGGVHFLGYQEAGIQAALESVQQGKGVTLEAAKARIDRILGR